VGETPGGSWVDTQAVYGKEYSYRLQMIVPAGSGVAESELSPFIRFTPVDQFAPAVPAGLTAITGITTVELAWERSSEADTAGYYVYRGMGEDALTRISELLAAASYSDHDVRSGGSYRYAVTAVDDKGNESAQSAVISVTAP
jgi:fibronectin type 3 domain-containing protein